MVMCGCHNFSLRPPSSLEPKAEDSLNSPSACPLSTECPALDTALVQHLYYCSRLLLVRLVAFPQPSFYFRELSTPALSYIPQYPRSLASGSY